MAANGVPPPSTFAVCRDIYHREGIRGLNKGANAVALRQMTGWASRIGLTRVSEGGVRWATGKREEAKLSAGEKILSSCAGGALSCWNQPLEVGQAVRRVVTAGHTDRDAIAHPIGSSQAGCTTANDSGDGEVHREDKRRRGSVPRYYSEDRARGECDHFHGDFWRHGQGVDREIAVTGNDASDRSEGSSSAYSKWSLSGQRC